MDTLSHALWGKGLFGYRKYGSFAILFGALPDLLSFGLYFLYNIIFNFTSLTMGKPAIEEIPKWVFILYDFSHSLIIALLFISVVFIYSKKIIFPMLAWPFHILLDIFTHRTDYFPTPFLWPLSNFRFNGIPWSEPYIWFGNFLCIAFLFAYRHKRKKINIS